MSIGSMKQAARSSGNRNSEGYPNVLVRYVGANLGKGKNRDEANDVLIGELYASVDGIPAGTQVNIKVSADSADKTETNRKHGVWEIAKGKNNNEPLVAGQFIVFDKCTIRKTADAVNITAEYVNRPFGKKGTFDQSTMYLFDDAVVSVRPERERSDSKGQVYKVQSAVISFPEKSVTFNSEASFAEAVKLGFDSFMEEVSLYVRGIDPAGETGLEAYAKEFIRRWRKDDARMETPEEFTARVLADDSSKGFFAEAFSGNTSQVWEVIPQIRLDYGANSTLSGHIAAAQANGKILNPSDPKDANRLFAMDDANKFLIGSGEHRECGWAHCHVPMQRKFDAHEQTYGRWFGTGVSPVARFPLRYGMHEMLTPNTPAAAVVAFTNNAQAVAQTSRDQRSANYEASKGAAPEHETSGPTPF